MIWRHNARNKGMCNNPSQRQNSNCRRWGLIIYLMGGELKINYGHLRILQIMDSLLTNGTQIFFNIPHAEIFFVDLTNNLLTLIIVHQ